MAKKKRKRTKLHLGGQSAQPSKDTNTHARTGPGVNIKQPRCTGQQHREKAEGTGNLTLAFPGPHMKNHRGARSPRPKPEGPATDNPTVQPRTGTTRREPNAFAADAIMIPLQQFENL